MNPWWLRPAAEENAPKGDKPEKTPKSEDSAKPAKPAKSGKPKGASRAKKSDTGAAKRSAARSAKPSEAKSDAEPRRSGRKRSSGRRRKSAARGQRQMALFCDVESITLAMQSVDIEELDLELLLKQLGNRGQVASKKAYGDWHRLSDLEDGFRSAGLDVIDIPAAPHSGGSNVSIPLALDAMELCYSERPPGTFVIFSAEADLRPLVEKLKAAGKQVLGLGVHDAILPTLAESCDEFIFYNELAPAEPETAPEIEPAAEIDDSKAPLFSALVEIIDSLGEAGDEVIWGSKLKREMRQRQPDFDPGSLGYATFSEFLEDADRHQVIHLERDDRSGSYYVTGDARQ